MADPDLADTDALGFVVAYLGSHPALTAALGAGHHVGQDDYPPYPMLRVRQMAGGSDERMLWKRSAEIQLEAIGDVDGSPPSTTLQRILTIALSALVALKDRTPAPGEPVFTAVLPAMKAHPSDLPNNQPRWLGSRLLHYHPYNGPST